MATGDNDGPLFQRLAGIFEDVFGLERDRFSESAVPEDVAHWDSVGHMNLVLRLEDVFGQRFEVDEIMDMSSVGKILGILRAKGIAG